MVTYLLEGVLDLTKCCKEVLSGKDIFVVHLHLCLSSSRPFGVLDFSSMFFHFQSVPKTFLSDGFVL